MRIRNLLSNKLFRATFFVCLAIICLLLLQLIILDFIVNPIVYWLASTKGIRILLAFILSWLIISKLFDLYYQYYKNKILKQKFNALSIPIQRKFKGRIQKKY